MRLKTLASCLLLAFPVVQGQAKDTEALREIEKERTNLLEAIVRQLERQHEEGRCELNEVINAKVRLNKLQRNLASDRKQKRKFQSRIVELEKLRFNGIQQLYKEGVSGATVLEVMRAQDRHLAARQRLLKMDELHGGADQDSGDKGEQR